MHSELNVCASYFVLVRHRTKATYTIFVFNTNAAQQCSNFSGRCKAFGIQPKHKSSALKRFCIAYVNIFNKTKVSEFPIVSATQYSGKLKWVSQKYMYSITNIAIRQFRFVFPIRQIPIILLFEWQSMCCSCVEWLFCKFIWLTKDFSSFSRQNSVPIIGLVIQIFNIGN